APAAPATEAPRRVVAEPQLPATGATTLPPDMALTAPGTDPSAEEIAEAPPATSSAPDAAPAASPDVSAEAQVPVPADAAGGSAPTPAADTTAPDRVAPEQASGERVAAMPEQVAALAPVDEAAERVTGQAPGDLAAPSDAGEATPDARDLYAQVLDHLRSLEPEPCFTALPALAEDNTLRFEVFGATDTQLQDFRSGIEARTGLIPGMVMRPITEGQCETLDFVRRAPDYPAYNLYFTLENREIASGTQLTGRVHNSFGRQVHLLLIDNSGRVHRLDTFLQFAGGTASFQIPMTLQGSPVDTFQLLLALAVPAWLDSVRALSGAADAQAFFAALNSEMDERGVAPDISLIAFSVR
ncbi:MAG: hypothetical protein JJU42_11450, partial [Rhodobacteraceae bacterium]|nr:hypothetical protein [Paracoccaceae bacterium]